MNRRAGAIHRDRRPTTTMNPITAAVAGLRSRRHRRPARRVHSWTTGRLLLAEVFDGARAMVRALRGR